TVEQPQPDNRRSDNRRNRRNVEDSTVKRQAAHFAVQQQRHENVEDQVDGQANQHHNQRIRKRDAKHTIFKQVFVIFQPNPVWRLEDVVISKAVVQGLSNRPDGENRQTDDRRRDKQQAVAEGSPLAYGHPRTAWKRNRRHGVTLQHTGRTGKSGWAERSYSAHPFELAN